jgi:hypothetical protein
MSMVFIYHTYVSLLRRTQRALAAVILVLAIAGNHTCGQEKFLYQPRDSSFMPLHHYGIELQLGSLFSSPASLSILYRNEFSFYLRQSLVHSWQSYPENFRDRDLIRSLWAHELKQQNKYQFLWNVLGAVEAGGALYLAYRHLHRYGLR